MSAPKFTPGTWAVESSDTYAYEIIAQPISKVLVLARVTTPQLEGSTVAERAQQAHANATVMVAGPDLYAALRLAREYLEGCVPLPVEALRRADAAIAKAEGRS